MSDLLTIGRTVEDEVRELNSAQWLSVMSQIRDLAAMTRRTA